jgi:hypothetical protein
VILLMNSGFESRPPSSIKTSLRTFGWYLISSAHEYPVRSGSSPAGDLGVGARLVRRAEPQQRLEGGHRGAAAVVAEDELSR